MPTDTVEQIMSKLKDRLPGMSPTVAQILTPPRPRYKGAEYLGDDFIPTDVKPSTGFFSDLASSYIRDGQGMAGETGIPGLKNIQGGVAWLSGHLQNTRFSDWQLDNAERLKARFPGWEPEPETLDGLTGEDYYKKHILPSVQEQIARAGYGEDYFKKFPEAEQAKAAYRKILPMVQNMQEGEAIEKSSGTAQYLGVGAGNFLLSAVSDFTNFLALGVPGVVKTTAREGLMAAAKVAIEQGAPRGLARRFSEAAVEKEVTRMAAGHLIRIAGTTTANTAQAYFQHTAYEKDMVETLKANADDVASTRFEAVGTAALMAGALSTGLSVLFKPRSLGENVAPAPAPLHAVAQMAKDAKNPTEVASADVFTQFVDKASEQMQHLTNNPNFLAPLWQNRSTWDEFAKVGTTMDTFVDLLQRNPTKDEIELFFESTQARLHEFNKQNFTADNFGWKPGDTPLNVKNSVIRHHKGTTLDFKNSIDKALYMITGPKMTRESATVVWDYLRTATGLKDHQIQSLAIAVRSEIMDGLQKHDDAYAKTVADLKAQRPTIDLQATGQKIKPVRDALVPDRTTIALKKNTEVVNTAIPGEGAVPVTLTSVDTVPTKTVLKKEVTGFEPTATTVKLSEVRPDIPDRPIYSVDITALKYIYGLLESGNLPPNTVPIKGRKPSIPSLPIDAETRLQQDRASLAKLKNIRRKMIRDAGAQTPEDLGKIDRDINRITTRIDNTAKDLGGTGLKQDVQVKELPRGQTHDLTSTKAILDGTGFLIEDGENTPRAINKNWVFKNVLTPVGLKWISTGAYETLNSAHAAIRFLANMVANTMLQEDSAGPIKQRVNTFRNQRDRVQGAQRVGMVKLRDYAKKFKLTAAEKAEVDEEAHKMLGLEGYMPAKFNNDPRLAQATRLRANALKEQYDHFTKRGVDAGRFAYADEHYTNTPFKANMKPHAHRIQAALHKVWTRYFTDRGELHQNTLKGLGIIGEDGNVKPGANYPEGFKIQKFDDLLPVDQKRYLADIYDTSTDDAGVPKGHLMRDAKGAVEARLGERYADLDDPQRVLGTAYNAATERRIRQEVWFEPELREFMETDMEKILVHYMENTAYSVAKKESVNAAVYKLTGLKRQDIDFDKLVDAVGAKIHDSVEPEQWDMLRLALDKIKEKEKYVDIRLNKLEIGSRGAVDFGISTAMNVARIAVSAINSPQQIISEWPQILIHAAFGGPKNLWAAIKPIFQPMANHELRGLAYFGEEMQAHSTRLIYDMDSSDLLNQNWWDKAVANPMERLKRSVQLGATPTQKVAGAITSATDWMARLASATSAEDFTMQLTRRMAVNSERFRLGQAIKKAKKLQGLLEAEDWSKLETQAARDKVFDRACRKAGVDSVYARRLNDGGLLHSSYLDVLTEMDGEANGKILKDNAFDYDEMSKGVNKGKNYDMQEARRLVVEQTNSFLESQVDNIVIRQDPWTARTDPASTSTWGRLHNAFLSYSRGWFSKTMLDRVGNERALMSMAILGTAVMSEVIWQNTSKVIYKGQTFDDIRADWEENPGSMFLQGLARTNFLGGFQGTMFAMLDSMVDVLPGNNAASAPYPIHAAMNSLKVMGKVVASALSDDVELTNQDAQTINRLIPVMGNPYVNLVAKAAGWKGMWEFIHSDD